jgi:two-component system nitrogen regulation response regulator NtrX
MSTILVADDDVALRRRLCHILVEAGLNTVEAEDGYQALDAVRRYVLDLVFLDVAMPGLNGLETLRILRRSHPRLRVCMLTMHGNQELLLQTAGFEAVRFLTKPVDPQRVLRMISEFCPSPPRHA